MVSRISFDFETAKHNYFLKLLIKKKTIGILFELDLKAGRLSALYHFKS